MSSVHSYISQISGRVKYFVGLRDASGYTPLLGVGSTQSLMTSTIFGGNITKLLGALSPSVNIGTVLRDMGKSVTVINDVTKQQTTVYRLVEKENSVPEQFGEGSFGTTPAPSSSVFWLRVWDSNGEDVSIARTG